MPKQSLNIGLSLKPFADFLRKFHIIIFFVAVSISLMVAILIIVSILNLSASSATTTDAAVSGSFDEATIERIDNLETQSPSEPGDRPSPFVEP